MNRVAAVAAALLILVLAVGASVLAAPSERANDHALLADPSPGSEEPDELKADDPESQDEEGATPSDQLLDRIVSRLDDQGIQTDAETVAGLAETYGVGGAVRLLAWADAAGVSTDEIAAMFDSGLGWGEIAQQLNESDDSLHIRPGIGWVMGQGHRHDDGPGNGLGRAYGRLTAPGQQNK